ncbi:hypothetical protein Q8A73_014012 [Channa argus]|nr:hypothetical protein Q8A73_014012 [Channa argus]
MCSQVHEDGRLCVSTPGLLCSLLNYDSELKRGGVKYMLVCAHAFRSKHDCACECVRTCVLKSPCMDKSVQAVAARRSEIQAYLHSQSNREEAWGSLAAEKEQWQKRKSKGRMMQGEKEGGSEVRGVKEK